MDAEVIVSLLKAALAVVGFLFVSLIGIVSWFLKGFAHEVAKVSEAVTKMGADYAVTRSVVDALKERVNSVSENHATRIAALERQVTGLEHDNETSKRKLERMGSTQ